MDVETRAHAGVLSEEKLSAGGRLELLLCMFPRGDGEPWKLRELERATEAAGYRVSASHLNHVISGAIRRPRRRFRETVARVVGFPEDLWEADPGEWQGILDREGICLDAAGEAVMRDRRSYLALHERMARLSPTARAAVEALVERLLAEGA